MITITVKQLIEASSCGALGRYLSLDKPIGVAWQNRGQVGACNAEVKLYQEKQVELATKHGVKDTENPNLFRFDVGMELKPGESGPAQKAFTAAMTELLAQPVDTIPGKPVSVQHLNGRLSEADLLTLEPFLTD
jgi:hypothetical protein